MTFTRPKPCGRRTYSVEVRDLSTRAFACDCVAFRINGLGTRKHVEAVFAHLKARLKRRFKNAAFTSSPRLEILPAPAAATDLKSPIANLQLPCPKFLCQIPSPQIHLHPTKLA